MTKQFLIFCISVFSIAGNLYGQNNISYSYENNGNRYERHVVTLKSSVESDSSQVTEGVSLAVSETVVTVFPNPTKGEINVVASEPIDGGILSVYDMSGRSLLIQDFSGKETSIDLNNQNPGQYILVILFGNEKKEVTIIKE